MSRANVEFVEGLFAGAAGADKQALLAALPELIAATCDPEIEWIEDPQRADSRVYRGHLGVRESWERWLEGFDEYSFEIEEVVDCGDDVLVVGRERAQGASSGAAVSSRNYEVLTIEMARSCATASSTTSGPHGAPPDCRDLGCRVASCAG
jgi:ketosteroid isomerase-like protein